MNVEKPGQKRVKQSEHSPPPKRPRTAARTTSLATKSCPEFNFRHKFSLLVVGPTQSGKTYFVQQILENNRIVYEEQKSIRIFWYYNQWQECYEKLKKSLGKSIRFERGVPELSEDPCEINPRYNNIIILDDLMAEATDTKAAIETPALSYCCKTCSLRGKIIQISAEMPSTWLSSEVLAIENKSELLENACLTRIECTLMNAYYKETEKPYGYLLVDNKPGTPPDNQILADLFRECYAYHYGVNSTEPTRVETKPVGKHSTATKTTSSRKKPVQTWSVPNDVWQKYTLGAPEVCKIPEGYAFTEMYNTSRNENHQPVRGGVLINDENYWPVKLKHRSTSHTKWVNLHSDEPTVQFIVKETMENTTEPKINYRPN